MKNILKPKNATVTVSISEEELRQRLADEFAAEVGLIGPDGKRRPGVEITVRRGESRKGGYTISAKQDLQLTRQLLPSPGGDE